MTFDQTVLMVTGAPSGIGLRAVERFADEGAQVIACNIAAPAGQRAGVTYIRLDVTEEPGWESPIAAAIERFGWLDALVNCAGIVLMGNVVDVALRLSSGSWLSMSREPFSE